MGDDCFSIGSIKCPICDNGMMEFDLDLGLWICFECDYSEERE